MLCAQICFRSGIVSVVCGVGCKKSQSRLSLFPAVLIVDPGTPRKRRGGIKYLAYVLLSKKRVGWLLESLFSANVLMCFKSVSF